MRIVFDDVLVLDHAIAEPNERHHAMLPRGTFGRVRPLALVLVLATASCADACDAPSPTTMTIITVEGGAARPAFPPAPRDWRSYFDASEEPMMIGFGSHPPAPSDFAWESDCVSCASGRVRVGADGAATWRDHGRDRVVKLSDQALARVAAVIVTEGFFAMPDVIGAAGPLSTITVTMNGQKKTVQLHVGSVTSDAAQEPRVAAFFEVMSAMNSEIYRATDDDD